MEKKFVYGVTYKASLKDKIVIDLTKATCFAGLRSFRFDKVALYRTAHKETSKYREKFLKIINKIFPISWDDEVVILDVNDSKIPKKLISTDYSDSKKIIAILMLLRILFDDLGIGFDNVKLLELLTKIDIDSGDMMEELTKVLRDNENKFIISGMWNPNHFLASGDFRVITTEEFYNSRFDSINSFFRKRSNQQN